MCGITGAWDFAGGVDLAASGRRMAGRLGHRGPDASAVWADNDARVVLGHTRLAIIDLTPTGAQPMVDANTGNVVVLNGEIYNFAEIRHDLIARGHAFRGRSDTEVLLLGYAEWGKAVLERLNGMFAFAIWDARARQLFLARDRAGEKPLYWSWDNKRFLFGSEIKSLLEWPGERRRPNLAALHQYLTYGYAQAPLTAFEGIVRLPAAHALTIVPGRAPVIERYWHLPHPKDARPRPPADIHAELVDRLSQAVRLRMVADVPIGAFLSGGVDSSAVVAMMARASNDPIRTFSIGFEEESFDERSYARRVAERWQTAHTEFVVKPDAVAMLPRIVWHHGEPFADSSAIPTFYVSHLARREVTVVLNGDGGDENFLGYPRYFHSLTRPFNPRRAISSAPPAPAEARRPSLLSRLFGPRPEPRVLAMKPAQRTIAAAAPGGPTPAVAYSPSIELFYEHDKAASYGPALRSYLPQRQIDFIEPYFDEAPSLVAGAAWSDFHTYLPEDLLMKVDTASMSCGLEARAPFLDHLFLEWAAGIPWDQKIVDGETKAPLKEAMLPFVPRDVMYRPKMGFGVPIHRWFEQGPLADLAQEVLTDRTATARGLFDPAWVQAQLDVHRARQNNNQNKLWPMLFMELWHRMWIDPPTTPEPPGWPAGLGPAGIAGDSGPARATGPAA